MLAPCVHEHDPPALLGCLKHAPNRQRAGIILLFGREGAVQGGNDMIEQRKLGDTLSVTDGTHTANIALLGNYLASSFVSSSDGHGGTLITDPPSNQQPLLTHPHA
jgi:hypothetical protein